MGALPDNRTDVSGGHWRHRSGSQRPSRGGSEAERRPLWESETAESYNGAESGDVFAPAVSAASTSHGETPEESRARSLSESYRNHAAVRASAAAASSPLVSSPSRVRPHRPLWLNVRSGGSKPTETDHSSKNTIRRRRGVSEDCYVDNNGRGYDWGDSWGKSTRRLAESSTISPATFDPDFDTSRQHLTKLFKSLDTNGSGTVTVEAIQRGLGKLGTYSDINFLLRRADMEKSKEITLEGFIDTVQDYSTKMLADRQTLPVSCFCYDYSPETVSFRWVKTGAEERPMPFVSLRDLVAEKPQDHTQGSVRWVCLTGSNPSLVIYMANRYGIHPLQVEDCLNPTERLKVDAFRAPSKPAGASSNSSNSASKPSGAGASGQDDRNAARSPRPDVSPRGTSGGGDSHPLQSKNDPDRKKAEGFKDDIAPKPYASLTTPPPPGDQKRFTGRDKRSAAPPSRAGAPSRPMISCTLSWTEYPSSTPPPISPPSRALPASNESRCLYSSWVTTPSFSSSPNPRRSAIGYRTASFTPAASSGSTTRATWCTVSWTASWTTCSRSCSISRSGLWNSRESCTRRMTVRRSRWFAPSSRYRGTCT